MGERQLTNLTATNTTALLLDNNAYDGSRTDVTNSAGNLVLNTEAFAGEPEVCGTQCMDILADYWHKVEKTTIGYREFMITDVDKALETVQLSIINTDKDIAASLSATQERANSQRIADNDPGVFDENGDYGGDQGDAYKHQSGFFLFGKNEWHFNYNKDLYDFVRQHPEYANLTDKEIRTLFERMKKEGCGYVALANSIFVEFEGREAEFEKTFGFPMRDQDGNINFNKLIVDIYLETDNKYYLNNDYGKTALATAILHQYDDGGEAAFKAKYGCDLYGDETKNTYSDAAVEAVSKQVNNYTGDTYKIENERSTNPVSRFNRIDHYLEERGLTGNYSITYTEPKPNGGRTTVDTDAIRKDLEAGKEVIIGATTYYLDDENGKNKYTKINGGHAMSVTGVTDDGRLIVSSWGDKYYIDPNKSTLTYWSSFDIAE